MLEHFTLYPNSIVDLITTLGAVVLGYIIVMLIFIAYSVLVQGVNRVPINTNTRPDCGTNSDSDL
jgi:hypothetical protein